MVTIRLKEGVMKGSSNAALWAATVGFFIGFGSVSLFGPTAHLFKDIMRLTPTDIGFLVAIPMLTGSLLRIPFGAWVDSTGGRLPFLILLIASLIGLVGLFYMLKVLYPEHLTHADYPWLLLFGALAGCGIATFSIGIGQVSYWFPQNRQGWALAAYAGFGNTSPGLVALIVPAITAAFGLWVSYLVSAAILVAGLIFYFILGLNAPFFQFRKAGMTYDAAVTRARDKEQELFPKGNPLVTLWKSAVHWKTWPLVILYFTTFGGFLALTAWFPVYWRSFYNVPVMEAVGLTAGFSLFSALIRVPGGLWADRFGGESVAILSLLVLLVGAVIMTISQTFAWSVIGEVLIGAGMGVNNAAVFKLVPLYVPDYVGGTSGWVGGLGALGGFAVPPLLGYFVAKQGSVGYAHGMVVYVVLAVISLLLAVLLRQVRPKEALPA
ncbi:putative nitrate/nitrite transporter NarK2 [bacterium BMS3Abin12]|nr:putative nitrate/nitrite transporter NarK2 [bacterium BMS3Abin12]GBE49442.1 putative nitrate/nitrite transporter NarK2 [bacterium BMS3Bbin13]